MTRRTGAIATTLAALAIGAPAASAMPSPAYASAPSRAAASSAPHDDRPEASVMPQTGSLAPAARSAVPPYLSGPHPTPRAPIPAYLAGIHPTQHAPANVAAVDGDDGDSPLAYFLPGVALTLLLGGGAAHAARTSARARRARISV
jgi:hypothetical protein